MAFLHRLEGIDRVGDATPLNFPVGNHRPTLPLQPLPKHGQPGPVPGHGTSFFQGRMCTGKKYHFAQAKKFAGCPRNEEMSEMKGIKGPAKKTDPQS